MRYATLNNPQPSVRRRTPRRRGISSLLAMLYLVLFGTLAVGFYASTTTTVQVSANDEKVNRATLAAESGMDFMRRHLATLHVSTSGTPEEVLTKLHAVLEDRLEETGNLGASTVSFDGDTIRVPAIDLGSGSRFSVAVALADPASNKADVIVNVAGSASGLSSSARGVSMKFLMSEWPAPVLDYGVATRSTIAMDSNARVRGATDPTRGKILITSMDEPALTMQSNSLVTGQVALVNADNAVSKSGNTTINGQLNPVAGTAAASDIRLEADEPEFPEVDTSDFEKYAGNPLYGGIICALPGMKYDTVNVRNVLVKANTNPIFGGSIYVDGVIYIETPNKVTFDSNTKVRGVIAVENDPVGVPGVDNQITFLSNTSVSGVDTLPVSPFFPPELRSNVGAVILAPAFKVHVNSNFAVTGGHLVASQFHFDSNARGTINGSVINLDPLPITMNGNTDIAFGAPPAGHGTGIRFSGHFSPDQGSYREGL